MKHLPFWIGALALVALLGLVGEDDFKHQMTNTGYVEHVMEMAMQDELNRRHDAWFNLYEEPAPSLPMLAFK